MRVSVGIVDDHPALILGATGLINAQTDMQVVASGATVSEMLAWRQRTDVVLLDLMLADDSAPAANVKALMLTGSHVIAFTSGDRAHLVREAAHAGALGMIRKTDDPKEIIEAIRGASRGDVVASTDWADALDQDDGFVAAALTRREAQVLELYASGDTADRVAQRLHISLDTVLDHVRRIRTKYAAVNRPASTKVDLLRRAVEDGIVDFER